jgi:predicted nucleotidyltransferase
VVSQKGFTKLTSCYLKQIIQLLHPFSDFAFLLGSYGTERFNQTSDIDLAVYFSESVDQKKINELAVKIEELTGRDVDLVDIRDIDPIFARQIIETGRLLIDNKQEKLVNWRYLQLAKYIDFKMDRAEIEKKLLVRKSRD